MPRFLPITPVSAVAIWESDVGVATSGSNVTSWTDQKSSFVMSQGGAIAVPTVGTMNGRQAIVFSGSQALANASASPPALAFTGAKTVVVVAQLTTLPTSGNIASICTLRANSTNKLTELAILNNVATYQSVNLSFDTLNTPQNGVGYSPTLDTNPHEYVFTGDGVSNTAPSSFTASLDGVAKTVVASANSAQASIFSFGGRMSPGFALTLPMIGKIAAIYVYTSVLSAPALAQIHAYNVAKWGV